MRHVLYEGTVTGIDAGSTPETAELTVATPNDVQLIDVPKAFARAAYDRPARMVLEVDVEGEDIGLIARLRRENTDLRRRLGIADDAPTTTDAGACVLRSDVRARILAMVDGEQPITVGAVYALAAEYEEASDE